MRSLATACMATLAMCGSAYAAEITIPLGDGVEVERIEAIYDCGQANTRAVTYINAGSVSLAVLEIDGDTVVASNVISGSGARYAGAQYVWWNKGNEGSLYDLMKSDDETPVATCTATQ